MKNVNLLKICLLSTLMFVLQLSVSAQNVGITDDDTYTADPSAMLDVKSTDKGMLIPRVDFNDKPASPATGLLIFVSANGPEGNNAFYYYNGTAWKKIVGGASDEIIDTDGDTKIQVEETTDEDIIRFDIAGNEKWVMQGSRIEPANTGYSVFIGEGAGINDDLTDNNNTAIGYQSGDNITTGSHIVAIGYDAKPSNATDQYSVCIGSLSSAATSAVALGYNGGATNTGAVAIGYNTNSSGQYSTGVGYDVDATALYAVALGRGARASSNYAVSLGANSDATSLGSIALGKDAQATINDYACALGYNADASGLHSVAIGYNSIVTSDDEIVFGNSAILSIGGYQNWSNLSDARFKTNISENVPGLEFIQKLRPVTYQVDIDKLNSHLKVPKHNGDISKAKNIIHTGFIAQEVEQAAKELNFDFNGIQRPGNEKGHYGLRYATFVVPLVKAIQEQQKLIEDLKDNEAMLLQEINHIKEEIERIRKLKK
jgi:trimeric autotransporter adhesin